MRKQFGDAQLEEARNCASTIKKYHELQSIARFRGQEIRDYLIQAKRVAKNLAFARRLSDSYRRFAPRIAEGRDSYY
jgi:hypothetical protein